MAFATVDLLASVVATRPAGFRRLDALASLSRRRMSTTFYSKRYVPTGLSLLSVVGTAAAT
jgi:hypothetical protein